MRLMALVLVRIVGGGAMAKKVDAKNNTSVLLFLLSTT